MAKTYRPCVPEQDLLLPPTKNSLIAAAILIGGVLGVCAPAWAQGQPIIFSVIGDREGGLPGAHGQS